MNSAIRNIADSTARAFAEACYDVGCYENLPTEPDHVDMKQWGITAAQWKEAVDAAITDLNDDTK